MNRLQAQTLKKEQVFRGNLLLVNAQNPIKTEENKELVSADFRRPEILAKRDAANVLWLIFEKISAGNEIEIISGYRTKNEQSQIYETSLEENGEEYTRQFVALPQCSEHQTGLAIDLAHRADNIDFICPEFPQNGICESFRRAAPHYGFIQRYEKGKEHITGISPEPWHFRYVGYPHSEIIQKNGLSLEEYINFIKDYNEDCPYIYKNENRKTIEIYYAPCIGEETQICIPEKAVHQISGNNVDGFIVTVWRSENAEK